MRNIHSYIHLYTHTHTQQRISMSCCHSESRMISINVGKWKTKDKEHASIWTACPAIELQAKSVQKLHLWRNVHLWVSQALFLNKIKCTHIPELSAHWPLVGTGGFLLAHEALFALCHICASPANCQWLVRIDQGVWGYCQRQTGLDTTVSHFWFCVTFRMKTDVPITLPSGWMAAHNNEITFYM